MGQVATFFRSVYKINSHKLKIIKRLDRFYCAFLEMGALKVKKTPKRTSQVDYWQIAEASTAGSKHHRVAGFNPQGHFSNSKMLTIQCS